jgi:hypothetical protein
VAVEFDVHAAARTSDTSPTTNLLGVIC